MKSNQPRITLDNFSEVMGMLFSRLDKIEATVEQIKTSDWNAAKPVTTKELCEYLNITEPTVIRWRKKSVIPFYTIGSAVRYNLKKVIAALENQNLV